MTTQEEQLWNYIDGNCSEMDREAIEARLATDMLFNNLYQQLLDLNQIIAEETEIDEPSMSFTRNVMDKVQTEIAPVKLRTRVDSRIIYAIGGFFSITLLSILVYAFAVTDFTLGKVVQFDFDADIDKLIDPTVMMVFLFVNAGLLLVYLDFYLRKGLKKTQKKGD
jgi:hypothetical protein